MYKAYKRNKRLVTQYAAEGDLSKLKEVLKSHESTPCTGLEEMKADALYYSIRKCNINCVEYLLKEEGLTLSNLNRPVRNLIWSIHQTSNKQSDRLKMFRFLHENNIKDVPNTVIRHYLDKRLKVYFKMTLKEFSNELDLNALMDENINGSFYNREEFLNDIKFEIRNEKIDELL